MNKRFLSPGDSSGGGDGSDDAAQAAAAQSTASSEQSGQQDWRKLYETLKTQSDKQIAEAEKRRTGLQSTYTKEQEAHKATQEELETIRTQFEATDAEKNAAMSNLTTFQGSLTEKEKELETLRKGKQRADLIFGQFPELASFEAKELLPDAPDVDALTTKFENFRAELGLVKEKSKKEFGSGSSVLPNAKEDKVPDSITTLTNELSELAVTGKWKEYDKKYDELEKVRQALEPT